MLQPIYDNFFLWHNYAIITLYILERPSSWSTPRIRPSWPQSPVLDWGSFASLFHKYSCLFWPAQYLAVYSNDSWFTLNPPLPAGQLNTIVQVNNMATVHHIYTVTYIYITFILLFTPFFILIPLFWAGWLVHILLVCHTWLFTTNTTIILIDFG